MGNILIGITLASLVESLLFIKKPMSFMRALVDKRNIVLHSSARFPENKCISVVKLILKSINIVDSVF